MAIGVIGKVKGYSICSVNKKSLKNNELFAEIEKENKNIKESVEHTLKCNGIIYGFKKNKVIKALYLLEEKNDKKEKFLFLSKNICVEEITDEIKKEFEKIIIEDLKTQIGLGEYTRIEWNNDIIIPKTVKFGKFNIPLGLIFIFLGIILGIIINDVMFGFLIGICLGTSSAIIVKKK